MVKSRQDNYNKNVLLENEHMRDTQISNDAILLGRHYEIAYSKSKKSALIRPRFSSLAGAPETIALHGLGSTQQEVN